MHVSQLWLRARRLVLRRQIFCLRWWSGSCCVVTDPVVVLGGNTSVYQMTQAIVDTYPTLPKCLHCSNNTSRWSCLNVLQVYPQPVALARVNSLSCMTEAKRARKDEPRCHGGRSTMCQTRGYSTRTVQPLWTRNHTYTYAHVRYASSTSTFQPDDAPPHTSPLVTSPRSKCHHRRPCPPPATAS